MVELTENRNFVNETINQTALIHPAVFVVEYALARAIQKSGIYPTALIGYSLGEYVAACIAGVMSWQDALRIVTHRAHLVQALPQGAMLAIGLSEGEVRRYLSPDVCLAGINGISACVLSGTQDAITDISELLAREGYAFRWIRSSHAFHSTMLLPIADKLVQLLGNVQLNRPKIPYISNLTGDWITAEQACDPRYWAQHMCEPIRFYTGLQTLLQHRAYILLEVGPGNSLSALAKQYSNRVGRSDSTCISQMLRTKYDCQDDTKFLARTIESIRANGGLGDSMRFSSEGLEKASPVESTDSQSSQSD